MVTAADGHIAIKATPEMTTLGARFPSTVDSLVRRIEAPMHPGVRAGHRRRENGDVRQYFRVRAGAPKGHHSDISNVIMQRQCRIAAVGGTSDRTLDIEPEVAPRDAVDVCPSVATAIGTTAGWSGDAGTVDQVAESRWSTVPIGADAFVIGISVTAMRHIGSTEKVAQLFAHHVHVLICDCS